MLTADLIAEGWHCCDREPPPVGLPVLTLSAAGYRVTLEWDGWNWWMPGRTMGVYFVVEYWRERPCV